MIVPFYLYFQFFALPQLNATRAVSGHSVPIISCVAAGAGAIIRLFGPESIGGVGDIGAKTDAEVARTGLSADVIGPKVHTYLVTMLLDGLNDHVSEDNTPYRRETHSDSWPPCNV